MNKMKMSSWLILISLLLTFCFILSGCGSSSSSSNRTLDDKATDLAIVNTRLDDEANISIINFKTGETYNDLLDVEGQCYMVQHGAYIYIVDINGNKIIKFDYVNRAVVTDLSTGDSTKPYSICFASPTKAYIALNNTTYIGTFNPETMEMSDKQIDLSSMAASDNKLQQYHCMIKDNRLFVTLRQNTKNAEKTSAIAVIDTDSDEIIKELVLQTDGVSGMGQDALGGKLQTELTNSGNMYVNVVDSMSVTDDGGIEIIEDIDTANPTSRIIASESDYGGSMANWVFDTNTTGWAIVGVKPEYSLIRFDLSGTPTFTNVSSFQDQVFTYVLECSDDNLVLVGSKNEDSPGIWVYDANNDYQPLFSEPIDVGLLPNRILIIRD